MQVAEAGRVARWSKMTRADTLLLRRALKAGGKLPDDAGPTIIRTLRRMVANNVHKDGCKVERKVLLDLLGVGLSDRDFFRAERAGRAGQAG